VHHTKNAKKRNLLKGERLEEGIEENKIKI